MTASVLITGGNRGLGLSLVDKFVAEGWQVFAGHRELVRGDELPPRLSPRLVRLRLDVQDRASIDAAALAVKAHTGRLDVLINNAAVNPSPNGDVRVGDLDFEAITLAYDVNAVGPLRVTQSFLPLLERGERKLIINVSSEAGSIQKSGRDRGYGYCMSKAAMNMQTTILNRALAPNGFNVIAIHPGWMRTDMGGPNAALDPATSADGMYDVIDGVSATTPRFVQHDGKEYPW